MQGSSEHISVPTNFKLAADTWNGERGTAKGLFTPRNSQTAASKQRLQTCCCALASLQATLHKTLIFIGWVFAVSLFVGNCGHLRDTTLHFLSDCPNFMQRLNTFKVHMNHSHMFPSFRGSDRQGRKSHFLVLIQRISTPPLTLSSIHPFVLNTSRAIFKFERRCRWMELVYDNNI